MYKIFLDLDLEPSDNNGSMEFIVRGTKQQITRYLNRKGYPESHFIIEKMPPIISLDKFKKLLSKGN